jgi:hypothetical protein
MPKKKATGNLFRWTDDDQRYPWSGILDLVGDPDELNRIFREDIITGFLNTIESELKRKESLGDQRGATAREALSALRTIRILLNFKAVDPKKFLHIVLNFAFNACHVELLDPIKRGMRVTVGSHKRLGKKADHMGYESIIRAKIEEKGLPFSGEWLWKELTRDYPSEEKAFQAKGYKVWFAGGNDAEAEDKQAFQMQTGHPRTQMHRAKGTFVDIFERIRKKLANK